MKSYYNVEFKTTRNSVWHWEPAVQAENREQARNAVKTKYGSGTKVGQVRFKGMPGVKRTEAQIQDDCYSDL